MIGKDPETEPYEHTEGKHEGAEKGNYRWRQVFDDGHKDFFTQYWPNTIVTILGVLILTPLAGWIMSSPKTIILGIAIGLTMFIWVCAYALIRRFPADVLDPPQQSQPQTKQQAPVKERPAFGPFNAAPGKIGISVGGNLVSLAVADLEKQPYLPFGIGASSPLSIYVEDGLLFVDATIFSRDFKPFVIKRNQYESLQPGWDINSEGNKIIEVVDKDRLPVLQIVFRSDSEVLVNGIFVNTDARLIVVVTPETLRLLAPSSYSVNPLKPIFKYPSYLYQGKRAD